MVQTAKDSEDAFLMLRWYAEAVVFDEAPEPLPVLRHPEGFHKPGHIAYPVDPDIVMLKDIMEYQVEEMVYRIQGIPGNAGGPDGDLPGNGSIKPACGKHIKNIAGCPVKFEGCTRPGGEIIVMVMFRL